MHRSRVGVFLIDHPEECYDAAASFWAAALGRSRAEADVPTGDDPYESLGEQGSGPLLELQRTGPGTPARIHLDLEADDVSAEVARVVALGASVVEERDGYVILADPGSLLFCVVPVQTGEAFDEHATRWP